MIQSCTYRYVCGFDIEVIPKGKTISDVLKETLAQNEYKDLRQRIVMDDNSYAEVLSGCHVSEFFKAIEQQQGQGGPNLTK